MSFSLKNQIEAVYTKYPEVRNVRSKVFYYKLICEYYEGCIFNNVKGGSPNIKGSEWYRLPELESVIYYFNKLKKQY